MGRPVLRFLVWAFTVYERVLKMGYCQAAIDRFFTFESDDK